MVKKTLPLKAEVDGGTSSHDILFLLKLRKISMYSDLLSKFRI